MFLRTATRSIPSVARAGLAPRLSPAMRPAMRFQPMMRRDMSSQSSQSSPSKVVAIWRQVPSDVYPLIFFVSFACVAGIFTLGWHLVSDHTLRLLPDRVRGERATAE